MCALALTLLAAPPVAADSPSATEASVSVQLPFGGDGWVVSLRRASDDARASLALRPARGADAVARTAVPEWATPPDFQLSATSRQLAADDAAVLVELTAATAPERTHEATQIQIVWHGHRGDRGALEWTLVGRTQSSRLDPGGRFVFRSTSDGGKAELIRERRTGRGLCGSEAFGRTVYRRFQPGTGDFHEVVELEPYLRVADELRATLPDRPLNGPFTRGVYQWHRASSEWTRREQPPSRARPMELGDREGGTAWIVDADRHGARGEFATASVSSALRLRGIQIVPGLPGSAEHYRRLGRPSALLVLLEGGRSFRVELADASFEELVDRRGLFVEFPEPVRTSCLSVVLLGASPPDADRVALAEVSPWTVVDARSARETADRVVERIADEPKLARRREIGHLASRLGSELAPAVERALESTEGVRRRRIVPLLKHVPPERAIPTLFEVFRQLSTDAPEYRAVKRSLASHGRRVAGRLLETLDRYDVDDPKYVDLVRLLGRVGAPEHLRKLVDDLGTGSESVRNERARALANGGRSVLPALFETLDAGEEAPVRRDALKAIYLTGKRTSSKQPIQVEGSSALRGVLVSGTDRRNLVLAFRAARHVAVANYATAVERALEEPLAAPVREAAVGSTGAYSGAAARRLAERALRDRSPDVRMAAVDALGRRSDLAASVSTLQSYVRRESWPPARQRALELLARIDSPETTAFFANLIRNRREAEVAVQAADALFKTQRGLSAELARDIVTDESAAARLRLEIVDLLGLGDAESGRRLLLDLIDRTWLSAHVADRKLAQRMRLRAVLSLGRRREATDRRRLFGYAKGDGTLTFRRHAVRALAFYSDPQLMSSLKAWQSEAPPELRSVIRQTIELMGNRETIQQLDRQIRETIESTDDAATDTDDS
ncbi:MAG: HEAT repeat domain-containing protein [Bradymonadaceae bacterium]